MIDLNCDMGDLEDAAHEAALMEHITSANVARGAHAGDGATMQRTIRAVERGVRIGAAPRLSSAWSTRPPGVSQAR